jgi:hypothetical protein
MQIKKELYPRLSPVSLPLDWEERTLDVAIEVLSDIRECDEMQVFIKWQMVMGKQRPLLYFLFAGNTPSTEHMPRVHLDPQGVMRPAHAICLVSLPSGNLIEGQKLRDLIRKGVEDFLRHFNVKAKD